MTPKEQAEKLYDDAYRRWCYELSHEKNVLTAKDIATYMAKLVIKEIGFSPNDEYWGEVIDEIQKLQK